MRSGVKKIWKRGESDPDMISKLFKSFDSSQRRTLLFSSALIALMMACVGISYVQLMHHIIPGWHGGYLPWLFGLIALETTYTQFSNRDKSFNDQLGRMIAEWVVLFFIIKISDHDCG